MRAANKYRLDCLIWNEILHIRLFWNMCWNLLLASRLKYGFHRVFPPQATQPSPTGVQAVYHVSILPHDKHTVMATFTLMRYAKAEILASYSVPKQRLVSKHA